MKTMELHSVVENALTCDTIESEIDLQLNCFNFSDEYPWEKNETSCPLNYGLDVTAKFFYKDGFGIKQRHQI